MGGAFAGAVVDAYAAAGGQVDAGVRHRIQRLWELREIDGLQFALRTGDTAEWEDAVRKLRVGPLLNPAGM
jgi:hypothetical protein